MFRQIGDENVHLVECLMDEVFGSTNFISEIILQKTSGQDQDFLDNTCDLLLWFGKSKNSLKYRQIYIEKNNRVVPTGKSLSYVKFLNDFSAYPLNNFWNDVATTSFGGRKKQYVVETNPKIIERCLLMTTDPGDLVLDPTMGSATTAYVAEQWGRRWIMIDTSRVALALARTRLMSAKFPYYLLADSPEGIQKTAEMTKQLPAQVQTNHDIRRGFVYKHVPHVTLKSIANNPEVDPTHEK